MQKTIFRLAIAVILLVLPLWVLNNLGIFDDFRRVEQAFNEGPELVEAEDLPAPIALPQLRFGLATDSFELIEATVERNQNFSDILLAQGVDYARIHRISTEFRDSFDLRRLQAGRPYTLFRESESDSSQNQRLRYLVYHINPIEYVVFDLGDSLSVYRGRETVSTQRRSLTGQIESSLYETVIAAGGSPLLPVKLSEIYAWTIDFFRIQPGDYFKVIFEERYIRDTVWIGLGRIIGAEFFHGGQSYYAFAYRKDSLYTDYFDEQGRSLRKAFLKAPLDFYRISSRYNPKRFHPVLKRMKPHLGTDYAAPHGTPIMSTADGEVIAAAYTRGNGNYVKVRHNSTYTTQYLHMSKFGPGIKKGQRVRQGQVIGYVGSTGLATGPHVCYRFWVNGRQVDPLKQDLPEAEPIDEAHRPAFEALMQPLRRSIDSLPLGPKSSANDHLALAALGFAPKE